jgi:hypothetical protein
VAVPSKVVEIEVSSSKERLMAEPMTPTSRSAAMTSTRTAATAAALTATLGLAAASWVVAVRQMHGMDMGVATRLDWLASFVALWVPMMAATMLPGAAPAVLGRAHASKEGRRDNG